MRYQFGDPVFASLAFAYLKIRFSAACCHWLAILNAAIGGLVAMEYLYFLSIVFSLSGAHFLVLCCGLCDNKWQ